MNIQKIIKQFEEETGSKVIYLTKSGSKLYGTDNENSDTDYKGIFIPSHDSVITKSDLPHYSNNTNNKNEKNSADDIDFHLDSIYSFFRNLKKGETGAMDLLFSMHRKDTIVYQDAKHINIFRKNYMKFLNRNLHSFVGYCIGQSKKYNIKGNRFKELVDFNKKIYVWTEHRLDTKLDDGKGSWEHLKSWVNAQDYKYIKFVRARGPMTSLNKYPEIDYIEVLGSKYPGHITCGEFYNKVDEMEAQFGHRTRAQQEGPDWKALSHAVRVMEEVDELLDTKFIQFPLANAYYIKRVKTGKEELGSVMNYIDASLDIVNKKLEESDLPEKSDETYMNELLLKWIK